MNPPPLGQDPPVPLLTTVEPSALCHRFVVMVMPRPVLLSIWMLSAKYEAPELLVCQVTVTDTDPGVVLPSPATSLKVHVVVPLVEALAGAAVSAVAEQATRPTTLMATTRFLRITRPPRVMR